MKRKTIAITGGIGSGKSVVAQILRDYGYVTVDCDQLSRQVADMPQVVSQVASLLGEQFVVDGKLNRAAIRNVIFADSSLLEQYNQIFFDKIRQLLVEQANATQGLLFVEIPLINAFPFDWTEIWLIKASQQDQIARVTLRDGVSCQNVSQIIGSQVQTEQATRVIVNDGTLDELKQKVALALQQSNLA